MAVKGKVQDVGFRNRVENFGRGFDLRGQVQNEKNGNVKILYGGENGSVGYFEDVIRRVTMNDEIIENSQLPLGMYYNLPYPFGRVHTDDEEDVGRKLDIGNDFLRGIKKGIDNLNVGFNNLNTKFGSFIVGQTEHNNRLEAILEKLAEK
jgi:acylphosphatase